MPNAPLVATYKTNNEQSILGEMMRDTMITTLITIILGSFQMMSCGTVEEEANDSKSNGTALIKDAAMGQTGSEDFTGLEKSKATLLDIEVNYLSKREKIIPAAGIVVPRKNGDLFYRLEMKPSELKAVTIRTLGGHRCARDLYSKINSLTIDDSEPLYHTIGKCGSKGRAEYLISIAVMQANMIVLKIELAN